MMNLLKLRALVFPVLLGSILPLTTEAATGAQLGTSCYWDASCQSGFCSSRWFSLGACVECENDEHCGGGGPGGTASGQTTTKSYCVENLCSEWKRGKPIDLEQGYPIWFHEASEDDGPLWMKRHIMDEVGPVMEHVWYWDLDHQPEGTEFSVNDTHVTVTLNTQTISGYSRTFHMYGEHETGISTSAFLVNPVSVITPYASSGLIEKLHTLSYSGNWSTVHVDRIRAERAERGPEGDRKAANDRVKRSYLMGSLVANVIGAQVESSQDIHHLDQIREHVRSHVRDGTSASVFKDNPGFNLEKGRAKEALEDAKVMTAMKSEQHCKHFEEVPELVTNETHIIIPLNQAITVLGGEMVYAPTYHLGITGGVLTARYDAEENALIMYNQAFQVARGYSDPKIHKDDWPYPSGIWLGATSEDSPARSDLDGRMDQFFEDTKPDTGFFINQYLQMPIDYDIYDEPLEKCPEDLRDRLEHVWEEADLEEAVVSDDPNENNILASIKRQVSLLRLGAEGAPCGSSFMSSDYGPGVVGLGINEFGVWVHLILEIDNENTGYMATSDFWNDWQSFLSDYGDGPAVTTQAGGENFWS